MTAIVVPPVDINPPEHSTALSGETRKPEDSRDPLSRLMVKRNPDSSRKVSANPKAFIDDVVGKALSLKFRTLLTPERHRNKTGIADEPREPTPAWWIFSKESLREEPECPADADDMVSRLVMIDPGFGGTCQDNQLLIKQELIRLSDLLVDNAATSTDVSLYVLLSYGLNKFNPAKLGRSKRTSLHVVDPPCARVVSIYFAMDTIAADSEVKLLAMFLFRGLMCSLDAKNYCEPNYFIASQCSDMLVFPKQMKDSRIYLH